MSEEQYKLAGCFRRGYTAGYTAGADAEREQCIRDMCWQCSVEKAWRHHDYGWVHYDKRDTTGKSLLPCDAMPIRRRVDGADDAK